MKKYLNKMHFYLFNNLMFTYMYMVRGKEFRYITGPQYSQD
jgi:hypothetical protein